MKRYVSFALILALAGSLLCTSAFAIKNVTTFEPEDVLSEEYIEKNKVSDWAADSMDAARAAGIIPDFTDDPAYQDAITREQFAELVVKFVEKCGIEIADAGNSFTDCDNASVLMAADADIVNGIGNDKFAPKTTTNREQIATMIYRAAEYIKSQNGKVLAPKAGSIAGYTDKNDVSGFAAEGVGILAANGIMKGTSDTTLSPKAPCTVEQSIILVYRLYEVYMGM